LRYLSAFGLVVAVLASTAGQAFAAKPGYEQSYYNGQEVTINAIEVPNHAPKQAQADFYEVVYPADHSLWPNDPQCDPCDHQGNGIDPTDYHDHVLDSIPADPGHGEYTALWHVWVVMPVDPLSYQSQKAYAAELPMKSEAAIRKAVADGVAQVVDAQFYFLCAVVSPHAARS
jgi:hypothetical protein